MLDDSSILGAMVTGEGGGTPPAGGDDAGHTPSAGGDDAGHTPSAGGDSGGAGTPPAGGEGSGGASGTSEAAFLDDDVVELQSLGLIGDEPSDGAIAGDFATMPADVMGTYSPAELADDDLPIV